jgi:hypothetical protein
MSWKRRETTEKLCEKKSLKECNVFEYKGLDDSMRLI